MFSIKIFVFPGSNNEQDQPQDLLLRLLLAPRHLGPSILHFLGKNAGRRSKLFRKNNRNIVFVRDFRSSHFRF